MIARDSSFFRRREHGPDAARAGITFLDLMVYITVFAIVGGPVVSAMLIGARTTTEANAYAMLQERNRSALDRFAREVRGSQEGTIVVSPTNGTVTMITAAGFDGVDVIPGPSITYRLSTSIADGWGELIRRDNDTGQETTVCGRVDLAGSSVQAVGTGVRITLSHAQAIPRQPDSLRVTTTVSAYPRN